MNIGQRFPSVVVIRTNPLYKDLDFPGVPYSSQIKLGCKANILHGQICGILNLFLIDIIKDFSMLNLLLLTSYVDVIFMFC